MEIDQPQKTGVNLDQPIHASELSKSELQQALRELPSRLRWRKPALPTVGEVLRARETNKIKGNK